jgi:hypothetical protein
MSDQQWSDGARRLVFAAAAEAGKRGRAVIGTGHLLLALIDDEPQLAAELALGADALEALARSGADGERTQRPDEVRSDVSSPLVAQVDDGWSELWANRTVIQLTAEASAVLAREDTRFDVRRFARALIAEPGSAAAAIVGWATG